MKRILLGIGMMLILIFALARLQPAAADEVRDWEGFLTAYYAVPAPSLVVYEHRMGNWEGVATALYLARVTGAPVGAIVNLHSGGLSFTAILGRYHVAPQILYIPAIEGPPYGNAYGYWRKRGRVRVMAFSDAQFENRVLLLSTSRAFGIPIQTEAERVRAGVPFDTIVVQHEEGRDEPGWQGRGRGRGRGHGHEEGSNPGEGHGRGHGHGHGEGGED